MFGLEILVNWFFIVVGATLFLTVVNAAERKTMKEDDFCKANRKQM